MKKYIMVLMAANQNQMIICGRNRGGTELDAQAGGGAREA